MDQKCISLEGKLLGYEKKTLALTAIVIVIAGAAFYTGAKYEKHKLNALGLLVNKSANKQTADNSIKGTVTAKDDVSITLDMADGTSKNIPFSGNMTFGKDGAGSAADLFVGELVVIAGENDANGNFIPSNIRASKNSPKAPVPAPGDETTMPAPATTGTVVPAPKTSTTAPTITTPAPKTTPMTVPTPVAQ